MTFADISYQEGAGSETRRPTVPVFYNDLAATLEQIWTLLALGVTDARTPFHTPTAATVRADGSPALRTVVLRAVDREQRTLRFHTDRRSAKVGEIAADPRVGVHFYDASKKIQLRIGGRAQLHTEDALAEQAWDATRPHSRTCYQVVPKPGSVIDDPRLGDISPSAGGINAGRDAFAAVFVAIDSIEWLYLAARGHRRARFAWPNANLHAHWMVP